MYLAISFDKLSLTLLICLLCGSAIDAAAQAAEPDELTEPTKPTEPTEPADAAVEEPPAVDMIINERGRPLDVVYGESVRRVFAPQVHDWVVLDQQRLILYVTRSRPYLVTLRRKANLLTRSTVIVIERSNNSIDARFDQIQIEGFSYPIGRIEKLSVETAKRLRGIEVKTDPEN